MQHRIVVLGAGYAGLTAAGRIARRVRADGVEITLINPSTHFVERVRMHQLATGQQLAARSLADLVAGTGISVTLGTAGRLDAENAVVTLQDGRSISYDTLVYAVGSATALSAPGAAAHALEVSGHAAATKLRERLAAHAADDGPVVVVGAGMTGIEVASEVAETRPELAVTIVTDGRLGDWLSEKARRHLGAVFARLRISVVEDSTVESVAADGVLLADGTSVPSGLTVWTTGFTVPALAAESGLQTTDSGLIEVDSTFRSVSHPDVYAIGDAAFASGLGGKPLRMSCASGIPGAWQAADAIAARLTGRRVPKAPVRYFQQNISLGRNDAIVQFVTADDRVKDRALTGRLAVRYKEIVCRAALWSMAHPIPHPVRRRPAVSMMQ